MSDTNPLLQALPTTGRLPAEATVYSTWADLNQLFIEQLANGLVLQSPLASAVRSLSTSACIM
jgi:hypothetical protein